MQARTEWRNSSCTRIILATMTSTCEYLSLFLVHLPEASNISWMLCMWSEENNGNKMADRNLNISILSGSPAIALQISIVVWYLWLLIRCSLFLLSCAGTIGATSIFLWKYLRSQLWKAPLATWMNQSTWTYASIQRSGLNPWPWETPPQPSLPSAVLNSILCHFSGALFRIGWWRAAKDQLFWIGLLPPTPQIHLDPPSATEFRTWSLRYEFTLQVNSEILRNELWALENCIYFCTRLWSTCAIKLIVAWYLHVPGFWNSQGKRIPRKTWLIFDWNIIIHFCVYVRHENYQVFSEGMIPGFIRNSHHIALFNCTVVWTACRCVNETEF